MFLNYLLRKKNPQKTHPAMKQDGSIRIIDIDLENSQNNAKQITINNAEGKYPFKTPPKSV